MGDASGNGQPDHDAVALATAMRMQAAWHPDHRRIVETVLAVVETGEWTEYVDG